MFKDKKGFTMVEMLAVVIILALLVGIAVPAISSQLAKFRYNYYNSLETSVLSAGEEYFSDNRFSMPSEILYSNTVSISDLVSGGYISEVADYNGDVCDMDNSYVVVVRIGEGKYEYATCLVCNDDAYSTIDSDNYNETLKENLSSTGYKKDYCNAAWKTTDYINASYGINEVSWEETGDKLTVFNDGDTQKVSVVYNVPQTTVEKYIGMSYKAYKTVGGDGTEVLLGIEDGEVIYPNNLSDLVNQTYDSVNIDLNYELPSGDTKIINAEVKAIPNAKISVSIKHAQATDSKNAGDGYLSGELAGKLKFELSSSYTDSVGKYQYKLSTSSTWVDASCTVSGNACEFYFSDNFEGTIKFRAVDSSGDVISKIDESSEYSIKVDSIVPVCTVTMKYGSSDSVTTDKDTSTQEVLPITTSDSTANVTFNINCDETLSSSKINVIAGSGSGTVSEVNDGGSLSLATGDKYVVTPVGVDMAGNTSNSESAMIEINEEGVTAYGSACNRSGDSICWAPLYFAPISGNSFAEITSSGLSEVSYDFDVSYWFSFKWWNCYKGSTKTNMWFGFSDYFYRYRCWEGSACYEYLLEQKPTSASLYGTQIVTVGSHYGKLIDCEYGKFFSTP